MPVYMHVCLLMNLIIVAGGLNFCMTIACLAAAVEKCRGPLKVITWPWNAVSRNKRTIQNVITQSVPNLQGKDEYGMEVFNYL
jgi:hypothetical protein